MDWSKLAPQGPIVSLPAYPWQRGRHWIESEESRASRLGRPGAHPLLMTARATAERAWECDLDAVDLRWVRDHKVDGETVFPGAAYVECALAAQAELRGTRDGDTILEQVVLTRALVVARGARNTLSIACDPAEGTFHVASRRDEEPWTSHASGRVARGERWRAPAPLALARLRARLSKTIPSAALYEAFEARGLSYGAAFRGIKDLAIGDGEVLATIELDEAVDLSAYILHPALLDAAFQALLGSVLNETNDGPVVPVGIGRIRVVRPAGGHVVCHAVRRRGPEGLHADIVLADPDGEVLAEIADLECRPVRPTERVPARWVHVPRWVPAPLESTQAQGEHERWAIVSPPGDLGEALVDGLAASGEAMRVTASDSTLLAGATRVIHVVPRGASAHEATAALLETVRALASSSRARLDVIVQGANAITEDEAPSSSAAAAAGLARVVMTERPALRTRLLDVAAAPLSVIVHALRATDGEEETALRGDARLALRHARGALENTARRAVVREQPIAQEPLELVVAEQGKLDSLAWRPATRRAPGAGEIELEVEAAALNFKDVLKAMGLLSSTALERTYLGTGLGMEAAGRVVRVGPGVSGFRVGDSVHAYVGGALRTHLTVDTRFATQRAPGHGAAEASSYFVFATAWYSLVEAGRLRKGDRVLIHSAAGGVGLAAVQIAKMIGAEVFATAGTEEKRALLREQGARHVFDSRTLDFAPEIMRATEGRGVHVVLNSLAEPALSKSLELLAPGGRFVELGKQDIAEGRALSLLPFNRNLTFSAVDLDRLAQETPEYFAPLMQDVLAAFASKRLSTLETTVFPASEVVLAFRKLASGRAIGKVVVDLSRGSLPIAPGLTPRPVVRADRTYLVSGGTSGFGLETAVWLSEGGAGRVVLASRRGSSAEAEVTMARLRAKGARVEAVALDVTDAVAVRDLISSLARSEVPLAGIFHSAMVLEDRPLSETDAASLARVLGPKLTGAANLDAASRDLSLDSFVVYSSVSAMVGNPGQGAYAAANAAIEALVRARRARGLAGLSIAWGALADVGVVARDANVAAHLGRLGLTPIEPARALAAMGRLLEEDHAHAGIIDIDWGRWVATNRDASWKRLADLVARDGGSGNGGDPLGERLAGLPPEAHPAVIREALVAAAAAVFRTEAANVDPTRPLKDLGLDSLMAVELQAAFAAATAVEIPSMELLGGRSIEALVPRVLRDRAAKGERGTRTREAPREGEALEAHLLSRICVQPPYFALRALRREGDRLFAEANPDGWHPQERGAVGSAEAARHLAILGSAAVSLEHPSEERVFYPVHRARLVETGAADLDRASVVSLTARCLAIDVTGSAATAETELRTMDGALICRFEVDYHMIPESSFRSLFAAHARETLEATTQESPYRKLRSLGVRFEGDEVVASVPKVEAADCLGHFVGMPAFPVSIMARDAFHLVAQGVGRQHGEGALLAVRGGSAETRRFVWAGEEATFRARRVAVHGPSDERWRCEISTSGELAAWFEMVIAIGQARTRK
jgi:NADPH:quinone reductase-like Zn-dependent oxidoreductase/acyl carrier protein